MLCCDAPHDERRLADGAVADHEDACGAVVRGTRAWRGGGAAARGSPCGSSCRPWRVIKVGSRRGSCVCVCCVGRIQAADATNRRRRVLHSSTPATRGLTPARPPRRAAAARRIGAADSGRRARDAGEAGVGRVGPRRHCVTGGRDARLPTPGERREATRRGGVRDSRGTSAPPDPPGSRPDSAARRWPLEHPRARATPRRQIASPNQREEVVHQHGGGGASLARAAK